MNGTYVRRRLKTASWERATELSRVIEDSDKPAETPERKDEPVTIVQAVTEDFADAKARELADATLYKLEIQLRKQFLNWCNAEGYKLPERIWPEGSPILSGFLDRRRTREEEEARTSDRFLLVLYPSRMVDRKPN